VYYPAARVTVGLLRGTGERKIGSIVIRCCEFDKTLAFRQQALRSPASDFALEDPDGNLFCMVEKADG
jgi:hypothetical protein